MSIMSLEEEFCTLVTLGLTRGHDKESRSFTGVSGRAGFCRDVRGRQRVRACRRKLTCNDGTAPMTGAPVAAKRGRRLANTPAALPDIRP